MQKLKISWYKIFIALIVGFFIFRGIEFALTILPFIPPDEKYHIDLSILFSKRLFMVRTEDLGSVGFILPPRHLPYLYHFLMGKLLWLNVFGLENYIFLRLINLALSCLTLLYAFRLADIVLEKKITKIFSLIILTNISQFSILSGSVSYDNLTNLCSFAAIYYFYRIVSRREGVWGFLLFILIGSLTKTSFLPLAVLLITAVTYDRRTDVFKKKLSFFNTSKAKIPTKAFVVFMIVLNLHLHLGNILSFRKLTPSCEQVMSSERCAKTKTFEQNNPDNLPTSKERVGYIPYLITWVYTSSTDLMHHRVMKNLYLPPVLSLLFFGLFIFFGSFVLFKIKLFPRGLKYLLLTTVVYILFLSLYTYTLSYMPSGLINRAMNGRYLLPVIMPMILLATTLLEKKLTSKMLITAVFSLSSFFIASDYVYFRTHITEDWTTKWYEKMKRENLGRYDYLEVNTHTGEPRGWNCYYIKCK